MSKFRIIVESQLKKIKEDAHADRANLLLALDTYEEVLQKLSEQLDLKKDYCDSDEETSVDLNTKFGYLRVYFSFDQDEEDTDSNGIYWRSGPTIVINLYNLLDLEKYISKRGINPYTGEENTIYLTGESLLKLARTGNCQNTFIHEFQHFLDDKNKQFLQKSAASFIGRPKEEWYWNSPHEKNAHYLAWLAKIASKSFNKYKKGLKDLTPEQRLDFLKNEWKNDEDFVSYYNELNDKSKKRFMSRLYNYLSTDFWNK